ncbi:hypothetical protein F5888DRAFT_1793109 [Russula emetica]|nr:hypothetical protein F5888DRAFT_1793109 [Russula emetica]
MKSYIFSIISTALLVVGVSAQLTVNTPVNVISCAPLQISFTGGTRSFPFILPGATPDGTALATFTNVTGSPFTWTAVNYAAQTSLGITLRDGTGASAQSAAFTVQTGGSTSCLNGTASGSNAPGAATTAASSPTTGAAATTGTTPAAGATTGSSGSSTAKASSPSSSGNAAIVAGIPYGVAGVLGAVVAAVFV